MLGRSRSAQNQDGVLHKVMRRRINDEPWFVGKDVAIALGYSNTRKALADHVDEEDKGVTKRDTLGGKQNLGIINESGLYSLILSSKLPHHVSTIKKSYILGYQNGSRDVNRHVNKEDKNTVVIHDRTSGNSNVGIINESVPYYMQPQKAKGVTQNEHSMTERKIPRVTE